VCVSLLSTGKRTPLQISPHFLRLTIFAGDDEVTPNSEPAPWIAPLMAPSPPIGRLVS
jgi:hypothetical protein